MADNRNTGVNLEQAAAKAQRDFEQAQANSVEQLTSIANLQEKDGKKYWFGVEVPPEMVQPLQTIAAIAPNYLSDLLRGGAYKHGTTVYNKLNKEFNFSTEPLAGHKAGLATAAIMTGLFIGAQPISEIAQAARERNKRRKEIKAVLAPVVETSPHAFDNNEVIKTVMERTDNILTAGIKQAVGEMPAVLVNGYYAVGRHKELMKEKTAAAEYKAAVDKSSTGVRSGNSDFKERLDEEDRIVADLEKTLKKRFLNGNNRELTNAEINQIKANCDRRIEEHRQKEKIIAEAKLRNPDSEKNEVSEQAKMLPILAGGFGNALLKRSLSKSDEEERKKNTAYGLIKELQEKVASGHISENSNITDQIVEIFQQNEIDRGRSGIGPVLQEKLEPLAKRIGEVIARKELDPLALVNLVGEGHVMNKRRFVEPEKLEQLLDEQRKVFGGHEKTALDEFLADFQSPKLIMAAIKDNIKNLEGKSKAMFISMLSDEVVEAAGVAKKDIPGDRSAGHDAMYEFVKAKAVELAAKSPEELKTMGLSEQQVESVNSLNELIQGGKDKEVKSAIDSGGPVVGAIRNAMLEKQLKEGKGSKAWADIINPKDPIIVKKMPEVSKAEAIHKEREGNTQQGGIA